MQMQTRSDETAVRYSFASLGELGQWIDATPRKWKARESESAFATTYDWDLNAGYKSAVNMAVNGWPEGAKAAQEALKAFTPNTPQPDTRTDFYGFRPHVPRFCAGAPDSMIRHTETDARNGAGRVLTLVVPVNARGYVTAQGMRNFGIAVTQYINQLETDGTRVELIGAITSVVSGKRLTHTWGIKGAEQPLDLAVTAFAIGHPAMFRRLGFALRERSSVREDSGYGSSTPTKLADLINPAPGTVILNGMTEADTHAPTAKAALAYVSRMIEAALAKQEL